MRDVEIHVPHRPGELARVAQMLGRYGVNIKSVAAVSFANEAVLRLIPDAIESARSALEEGNVRFTENELVTVLVENRAGQLADIVAKLSNVGVNLNALYVVGLVDDLVELAISVDNVKRAKKALE